MDAYLNVNPDVISIDNKLFPMGWNINNKEFDALSIRGKVINIYSNEGNYIPICVNEDIKEARWKGDGIVVHLKNGEIRKYLNTQLYIQTTATLSEKLLCFIKACTKIVTGRSSGSVRHIGQEEYSFPRTASLSK
jgi:hypothetical protein